MPRLKIKDIQLLIENNLIKKDKIKRTFCVAPMMGYTTPHARKLYRILSKKIFQRACLHAQNMDLNSKY